MSLIKCPECGHEVSTKAPACPQCGVLIAGNIKRCPVCNTILLRDAAECPKCHTHLVVEEAPATCHPGEGPEVYFDPPSVFMPMPEETISTEETKEEEAKDAEEPQVPRKRKSRAGWILTTVIIVLAALIGLIIWQIRVSREASAEEAYALLVDGNDLQNYEDFVMRYPHSRHIQEVQARMKELQAEEAAWQQAARSRDVSVVRAFVSEYPTSAHRSPALHRIDTLDWQNATKLNTPAAYNAYITAHEAGDFITEAYTARDEAVQREERARRDSIAAARRDSLTTLHPFGLDNLIH